MRRPLWFRTLTALWGVWFATALIEPAGLFACPMHSAVAPVTAAPAPSASPAPATGHHHHAAAAESATDAAAVVAATPVANSSGDSEQPGSGCCTCLGTCCTMAPAIVPATPVVPTAIVANAPLTSGHAHHQRTPERAAYTLPFANGPPATA